MNQEVVLNIRITQQNDEMEKVFGDSSNNNDVQWDNRGSHKKIGRQRVVQRPEVPRLRS